MGSDDVRDWVEELMSMLLDAQSKSVMREKLAEDGLRRIQSGFDFGDLVDVLDEAEHAVADLRRDSL